MPAVNPRPQQYLRVSGRIDPALNLKFSMLYGTTNRVCAKSLGAGVGTAPRSELFEYTVTPRDGAYAIALPMDGVDWGPCGWTMAMIHYSVEKVRSHVLRTTPRMACTRRAERAAAGEHQLLVSVPPPVAPYPHARLIRGCYNAPLEPYVLSPGVRELEVNVVDKG